MKCRVCENDARYITASGLWFCAIHAPSFRAMRRVDVPELLRLTDQLLDEIERRVTHDPPADRQARMVELDEELDETLKSVRGIIGRRPETKAGE